jgi:hypothetical protein
MLQRYINARTVINEFSLAKQLIFAGLNEIIEYLLL